MQRPLRYFSLAALLLPTGLLTGMAREPAPGSIVGVVRYTGQVPPPERILTTDGSTILHNDLVVDARTGGLRDVTVVLENAPARPPVKKGEPVVMDQRDMLFLPRVVAVLHGQPIRFDNSDSCNHSVMAASVIPDDQFNVFVNGGQPYEHTFALQKHPVRIGCSLHPWMRAWIYVLPHPWFAVTDAKGQFRIEDVPPGRYTLWLRHPDTGNQERHEVEVKPGQTVEVKIEWQKIGE